MPSLSADWVVLGVVAIIAATFVITRFIEAVESICSPAPVYRCDCDEDDEEEEEETTEANP